MQRLRAAVLLMIGGAILLSVSLGVGAVEVKVFTVADLVACVTTAGNVCVLQGNSYNLAGATLNVTASVTIRAAGPLSAITGASPVIRIQANRVLVDKIAVTGGGIGIEIQTAQDVTVQNGQVTGNGIGISVSTLGDVSNFRFLDLELRSNTGAGLRFANAGPVNGVVINRCTMEGNGTPGNLVFANGGEVRDVAIRQSQFNYGSGAGADGISFINGGGVREVEISGNQIQGNQGAGIYFNNTGSVEHVTIYNDNITANNGSNLWFDVQVRGIRDLKVDGNTLSTSIAGAGIAFTNGDILEDLTVSHNTIERNALDGIKIFNAGPLARAKFQGNTLRNNRRQGLWVNHAPPRDFRIENIEFSSNTFSQSNNDGVRLETGSNGISGLSFSSDRFSKNTNFGLEVLTDTGDISTVKFQQVTVDENQNGSGAVLLTNNASVSGVTIDGSTFKHNGLFGLRVQAGGNHDVGQISSKGSTYELNGSRGAVGQGSGLSIQGNTIRTISSENDTASSNNDHGVQVTASGIVSSVTIKDGAFSDNDSNIDTVGDGVNINANQDISGIDIEGSTANGNYNGFNIGSAGSQIAQGITVKDSTANGNRNAGVALIAGRDLTTAKLSGNQLGQDGIGIDLEIANVGSGIEVSTNRIEGASGAGIGIILNASGTKILNNSIRRNATGIVVKRSDGDAISQNDIVQNSGFGVDASTLGVGNAVDATNNWWGEPSGPGGVGPGIGDNVTVNVDYDPWLGAPAVVTGADFQVTGLNISPAAPAVGAPAAITATVTNTGTDEGTEDIIVRIKSGATVLHEERRTTPLSPAGDTTITLSYTFSAAGSYTVEVVTDNDTKTKAVTVGGGPGPGGKTIEEAIASLIAGDPASAANPDLVIGDQEILKAVEYWITGDEVPGTGGKRIDDKQMLDLIQLWIAGTAVSASAAGPASAGAAGAALRVERIAFTGSRFIVGGPGIRTIAVQVYDLAGRPVFADAASGNSLNFDAVDEAGGTWANGVYLYAVTVRGYDGAVVQSQVRKMVVLR